MEDCSVSGCWITTDDSRLLVLAVTHQTLSLVQTRSRDHRILSSHWSVSCPGTVGEGVGGGGLMTVAVKTAKTPS